MSWNSGQVLQIPVSQAEDDTRLDRWLKRRFPGLTQGQVEKLLRQGQVRVDGSRAKSNTRLQAGQSVRVPPMPTGESVKAKREETRVVNVSRSDAEFIRSLVVYEDDECIVLNKPSGLAVQGGTKTTKHVDAMSAALVPPGDEKPRLVHRLDRDTSGLLTLAKTAPAAADLAKLFRSRTLDKIYWAVVLGHPNPSEGELRGWMIKGSGPGEEKEKMRAAAHGEKSAAFAITDYKVVSNAAQKVSWVALKPLSGRKHQLRFQMAEIGYAILGDHKYTCDRETPAGPADMLHLHARALRLPRKHGKPIELVAPLPDHILDTFEMFGFEEHEAGNPFDTVQPMGRRR